MNSFCNITYAVASVPPWLIFEVDDDKVTSNLLTFRMLLQWLDGASGSIKLLPIDVENVANLDAGKLFPENKAEFIPLFVPISSIQPIGHLTPVMSDQKIAMMSLAPEAKIKPRDVLNLLSWDLWIFGGLIVLTALLVMRILISGTTRNSIWRILKATVWSTINLILLQNFSPRMVGKSKILMAGVASFIFLLITMLNCTMSTDLVIGEKPFTLDKLEDVLDPRASKFMPAWRKFGGVHELFSKSNSPIKRKIWQKAQRIGLDKCLTDTKLDTLVSLSEKYSDTPVVGFDFEGLFDFLRVHSCGQFMPIQDKKVHIGSESIGHELLGLPYHLKNDSCRDQKKSGIEAWSTAAFEANVLNHAFYKSHISVTFTVTDSLYKNWRCLFDKDPFDQEKWLQIGTLNMNNLFAFLFCGILFSLFILLSEIVWFSLT